MVLEIKFKHHFCVKGKPMWGNEVFLEILIKLFKV